jgi:hypothetical protein
MRTTARTPEFVNVETSSIKNSKTKFPKYRKQGLDLIGS